MRKILIMAALAVLLGLLASSRAHAWGATRMTTTYVNPSTGGVGQYSRTTAYGPNGLYRGDSISGYGRYGAYDADRYRAYSPYRYDDYSAAGFGGYRAGVYRARW